MTYPGKVFKAESNSRNRPFTERLGAQECDGKSSAQSRRSQQSNSLANKVKWILGRIYVYQKEKRIQALLYSSRVYLCTHSCHCSGSQFPYLNLVSDRYSQLLWSSGTFAVCIEFTGNKAPYTIYFCLELFAHSTKFCSYP